MLGLVRCGAGGVRLVFGCDLPMINVDVDVFVQRETPFFCFNSRSGAGEGGGGGRQ